MTYGISAATPLASVEVQADPRRPGRTGYRITGATAAIVQDAIDTLTRTVDPVFGGVGGYASFIGPLRTAAIEWGALGEIVIFQSEGAAA